VAKTPQASTGVTEVADGSGRRMRSSVEIGSAPRSMSGGPVHASVASEIGLRIVRGDYPPGTILPNEAEWSSIFGVSRSVVREAVKMLSAKGLLASRPKIGSWVEARERWNLLDRDVLAWYAGLPDRMLFLRTVQEFRYIIEPEAAALAATRRTDEQMSAISRACAEMGTAASLTERAGADARFHIAILRAAGNDLLVPLGALINSALDALFVHVTREMNNLRYAQELHEDIETCIRLRRPEAARKAVRRLLADTDAVIARQDRRPAGDQE
jgi:DNA-binding FadR family transcriptional regulator